MAEWKLWTMEGAYLCNHHVTIKGPFSVRSSRTVDMGADLGDDGSTKGHVGHEMAIHDVDLGCVSGIGSHSRREGRT